MVNPGNCGNSKNTTAVYTKILVLNKNTSTKPLSSIKIYE